jgi:predicted RND superfamily exporter protein
VTSARQLARRGDRWVAWLIRHRRRVLGMAAVSGLALAPLALSLGTNNSPEAFLLAGHPAVERHRELRATFGSDRLVRVGLLGAAPLGAADASWLRAAEVALAEVEGVASVLGPWSASGAPADWPGAESGPLGDALRRLPLVQGAGLVAPDGTAASLLVTLAPAAGDSAAVVRLLGTVQGALPPPPAGREVLLAGLPVLEQALDASSREVLTRFFPLLVAFAAGLLAVAFLPGRRDPRDAGLGWGSHLLAGLGVPLLFVGWCELAMAATLAAFGLELNLVLSILPPLVFVIALATAVHLVTRFRDLELAADTSPAGAVAATCADKGPAVLWATASTMVGFGSLALSPVLPVRHLGLAAAVTLALLAVAALSLLPVLLASLRRPPRGEHGRFERVARRLGTRLARRATRWRRGVLLGTAGLAALAAAGLPRLAVESNALHYLASDHPVRRAHDRLESLGMGTAAVELVFSGPPGTFAGGRTLGQLRWLAELLREEPGVLGVLGVGELVDTALRSSPAGRSGVLFGLDELRAATLRELAARPATRAALAGFVSSDHSTTRLLVFTPTAGLAVLDPLRERLLAVAREELPDTTVEPAGIFLLLLDTQRALLGTLGGSAAVTLLLVAGVFALLLRSLELTLRALVPNVLPVLLVFGAMGWFGWPLDLATVMVAATTLGLVVDDTLHTLVHYRELAPRLGRSGAVLAAVEANAAAYTITGLALAAGFGVCALSSFAPIARFGGLSAAAIALAVAADFVLVPALFSGPGERASGPPAATSPRPSPGDALSAG